MTKENKEMKSRFTYGMFAGFGLACLFIFFFLFFFPQVFRALTAKNSLPYAITVAMTHDPVYYQQDYVAYSIPGNREVPPAEPLGYDPNGYYASPTNAECPPAYDDQPSVSEVPYRLDPVIAYYNPAGDLPADYPGSPYTQQS
jgi:hypothetical protein